MNISSSSWYFMVSTRINIFSDLWMPDACGIFLLSCFFLPPKKAASGPKFLSPSCRGPCSEGLLARCIPGPRWLNWRLRFILLLLLQKWWFQHFLSQWRMKHICFNICAVFQRTNIHRVMRRVGNVSFFYGSFGDHPMNWWKPISHFPGCASIKSIVHT